LRSHKGIRTVISLLLTALFILSAAELLTLPLLSRVENILYDARLRNTIIGGIDERVVIVDIDERSLSVEGHWPWGRDKLARLVDTLFDHYYISLLGLDMVFAEYDSRSGLKTLEALAQGALASNQPYLSELEKLRSQLQYDNLFANSLRDRDVVLGFVHSKETQTGTLSFPVLQLSDKSKQIPFVTFEGYNTNLSELQQTAYAAGFFSNQLVSEDGVFRRVPLLTRHKDRLYESLSLAVVRGLLGQPPIELELVDSGFGQVGLEWLRVGDLRIPVDDQGAALVPYRGDSGSFRYVSATDVLSKKVPPEVLDGVIVLLGTSAPGLLDLRATPVGSTFNGVEIHANLITGMLDNRIMHHPGYTLAVEMLALLIIGLILSFTLPLLSPLWGSLLSISMLSSVVAVNLYFWNNGLHIHLASQLLLTLILIFFHNAYGYFVEAQGKKRLSRVFGHYVPPEIVSEMSEENSDFGISGESREMTVLFSDVVSFTSMSEKLEPDELTQLMNAYFTHMTEVVHQHRGTIDKYIGDAIMAFWGAPLSDSLHPQHAVVAALEMVARMEQVREEFVARGWPPLRNGVGINTGLMNVGNMGSEFRMAYTVLGDAVNLGARLEGQTRIYGVDIVVSEFTHAATSGIIYRELDRVQVKGKEQKVTIYEPLGIEGKVPASELKHLEQYHDALTAYQSGEWQKAETLFATLCELEPNRKVHQLYYERLSRSRGERRVLKRRNK
jgi:adenylate cyclase